MKNFKECKEEWLKNEEDKKILITEIGKKVKIILEEQKEIGFYFQFPHYKTIEKNKTYHWFFHRIESETMFECPCCESLKISDSYIHLGCDYLDVYDCPSCGYFSIRHYTAFPNYTIHSYLSSLTALRNFNSQLDKYLRNEVDYISIYFKNGERI